MIESAMVLLYWDGNFIWKGLSATVELIETVYEKGIKFCGKEKLALERRLKRLGRLPLYDITISPITVN